jgi:thiamine biosynthesis protein ThiS
MEIIVNGEVRQIGDPCTAAALLDGMNVTGRYAVELNGEILPKSLLREQLLRAGDRLEIVRAVGGG